MLKSVSIASAFFLTFVAGAFLMEARLFPASLVERAYFGARAAYQSFATYRDPYTTSLWYPVRSGAKGVTVHDPSQAFEGLTLYTSGHDAVAYLVDMDGTLLHQWHRPYSTVWRPDAGPKAPRPDTHVWFHSARVQPNGDLLGVYEAVGDTPYGYGLVKLDRYSKVLWTYFGATHHDVDVGPDGRIYALGQEIVDAPLDGYQNVGHPRLDDFLVILSADGDELSRISLIDSIERSPFRFLLQNVTWHGFNDPTHANSVEVIRPQDAEHFPFGEPGQILVSIRELATILVVDVPSEEVVWATRGSWIAQHDAQVLPDGNILMFDNRGHFERSEGISRIIEIDPRTTGVVWEYTGTAERPLASTVRSSVQRLPNGNTLISESDGGRLLEVTRRGDIVWEYFNPMRDEENRDLTPIVNGGERWPRSYFDREFGSGFTHDETLRTELERQ